MTAQVAIINRALIALGDDRIVSTGDEVKRARVMTELWPTSRDLLLGSYRWGFAMRRDRLPADVTAPTWGFTFRYPLPADFLQLDRVAGVYVWGGRAPDGAWRREGNAILADLSPPLAIRYVARIEDTGAYPPAFVAALALQLAYDAAPDLARSVNEREQIKRDLQDAIRQARVLSAIEDPPEETPTDDWILARRC